MGSVTNLKENKTLFIPCGCRSEVLMIEYDHENKMADLIIYKTDEVFRSRLSLWHKIRYCWQILWHNKLYSDEMMMDNKQLLDLKKFLASLNLA